MTDAREARGTSLDMAAVADFEPSFRLVAVKGHAHRLLRRSVPDLVRNELRAKKWSEAKISRWIESTQADDVLREFRIERSGTG